MAYRENLANLIRDRLITREGFAEKRMFGGIGFLLHGNMACGVLRDRLIVRVGAHHHREALTRPGSALFDVTGRPLTGWVQVSPEGWQNPGDLDAWVTMAVDFTESLPPK